MLLGGTSILHIRLNSTQLQLLTSCIQKLQKFRDIWVNVVSGLLEAVSLGFHIHFGQQ